MCVASVQGWWLGYCVKREAHRSHTEALGSSAQMRCVSCRYRENRVTAKSAIRTTRTIQILMRIRASPAFGSYPHREQKKAPSVPRAQDMRGLEGLCFLDTPSVSQARKAQNC